MTGAGGAVRIGGSYPPPPPPVRTPDADADAGLQALLARPPRVTRYELARGRPSRPVRPRASRVWAGTSMALAAASVGAVVLLPQDTGSPARLDTPVAVAATPGASTLPAEVATPAATSWQLSASEPVRVRIPALDVTSTVIRLGLERDGALEVPAGAYPVGWYEGGPTPGQLGPSVLAGHVDWEGERGAFYGLRELRAGDTVVIDRADGTVATFRIDRVERHAKEDFPTEEVYGDIEHAGLRLVTCGGAFDEGTGDYQDNVIVFATLTTG
ncbi:class F sortase [Blastococcus capsensis]|uniref:class F sortase n=1 Tax=Blastococcus capsensis TaxID=1564163 RepID=UPI002541C34C|nr:class F sortase [Blastococcus capsensis]MDK3257749.1 class F sortase [Blastococcus capsensis]